VIKFVTDHHDITEILLKVALKHHQTNKQKTKPFLIITRFPKAKKKYK